MHTSKATQAAISNSRHHKHKAIATYTHGCVWTLGGDLQRRSQVPTTFLDDFSKLSTVEPVAQKSEVATKVKEVFQRLETQTGQKLQKVRTDRGGEYLNTELDGYYKSKGVVHQTTATYTPEQKGAAERFNRTLMERVRAMLLDAKLDKELCAKAAVTANYIKNRSPSSSSTQTPWELFYGRKPDVSNMRVFGARAYVHVPKQLRYKLDPLSQGTIRRRKHRNFLSKQWSTSWVPLPKRAERQTKGVVQGSGSQSTSYRA